MFYIFYILDLKLLYVYRMLLPAIVNSVFVQTYVANRADFDSDSSLEICKGRKNESLFCRWMDKTGRLAERLISWLTVRFGRLTVSRRKTREDTRRMNGTKNKDSSKTAIQPMKRCGEHVGLDWC